jgi:alpha-amylase/alpha-mannosidase (GH57 family)
MWPAEGAVSQSAIGFFAEAGVEWLATDRGVLARSGRFGYDVEDPNVLGQPYRAEEASARIAVFFRDTDLSDRIGFRYAQAADPAEAARDFLAEIKRRFVDRVDDPANRVVCVALDGENAWGSYPEQGRLFLHALYTELAADPEIRTVTFGEYLQGNPERRVAAHAIDRLTRVHDLFTGSWIDEFGSAPGCDLGTWIGEPEENHAWELLRRSAAALEAAAALSAKDGTAYASLLAAEGSDWFWWFGNDQTSATDAEFDDLFRAHLKAAYRASGRRPPLELDAHIVPHAPVWTFARPIRAIQPGDRLVVRTNCPGRIEWRIAGQASWSAAELVRAGGVMTGLARYEQRLGPFPQDVRQLELRFICTHPGCEGGGPCCQGRPFSVSIGSADEAARTASRRKRRRRS